MLITQDLVSFFLFSLLYLTISIPLVVAYRVTKVINFTVATYIAYGAYTGVMLDYYLRRSIGGNYLVATAVASFIIGGTIGYLSNLLVFKPLSNKRVKPDVLMIASMGLWIVFKYTLYVISDIAGYFWKANLVSYGQIDYNDVASLASRFGLSGVQESYIVFPLVAGVSITLFLIMLGKTRVGRAILAVADNPTLASLSGVSVSRVENLTWFITSGLISLAGVMWTSYSGAITPEIGDSLILQAFTIAFIGGLTSIKRTAVGSFLISGVENFGTDFLSTYLGVPASIKPMLTFTVLIATLIVSPPLGAAGGIPYRFRRGGRI
jgi:branched-chain amino acid transport system permease protein